MVFRIDFRKYLFDISLAVYDERSAQNTHVFTTHELLLPPYAVGGSDGFVGIGYQRELQPVFVGKPAVRLFAVGTHADDFETVPLQLRITVPQTACFRRTAGRIVFRIEIEYQFLSPELFQRTSASADTISPVCPSTTGW